MAEPPAKKRQIEKEKARIAVAGAGWWGQGWHLPHLQRNEHSEISAIIEPCAAPRSTLNPDMKTTKELAEHYKVPVFTTIDEFLASEAVKNTDGVIIASNHASHHEAGMKAMAAGLHILMEKPMCTDIKEAHELVVENKKRGTIFMVNNSANYRIHAKKAHDIIKAGDIGEIQYVQCSMFSALRWLFDNPENKGWVTPTGNMIGNGFGWGQMSHTFAWIYMVTGLTPESVFCTMNYSKTTGGDIYDSVTIRCTNGATICAQGSACVPFKSYEESGKLIDNRIFGSTGMITFGGDDFKKDSGDLILTRHDGNKETVEEGFYFENYEAAGDGPESLKAFIDGCRGKEFFNGADAIVGLKAVQTIEAMYRSAKSNAFEKVQ